MSPPMIEWRCPGRCWVLRVTMDAKGWHLVGRPRRLHPERYLAETGLAEQGYTLEARDRGEVALPNLRKSRGLRLTVALNPSEWPTGTLAVGCKHGSTAAPRDSLIQDAVKARNTPSGSWPVTRQVPLT